MGLAQMQNYQPLPNRAVIGAFDRQERKYSDRSVNTQLLIELKQKHADVLAAAAEMEIAISRPMADVALIAHLRWKLTKADRAKYRFMDERIYPTILTRVTGRQAEQITKFREDYCAIQAAKSSHIALWTMDRVAEDWSGFKIAGATKVRRMRDRLLAEETLLHPLLS